jgi:hypothetical protein
MMIWKTLKKAIFDSCKPAHILFKHNRDAYSLTVLLLFLYINFKIKKTKVDI